MTRICVTLDRSRNLSIRVSPWDRDSPTRRDGGDVVRKQVVCASHGTAIYSVRLPCFGEPFPANRLS